MLHVSLFTINFYFIFLESHETFAKFLFPSFIVGLIIGKDGVEISSLMSRTNTNIKFSPGRELYPNTQDRVCCIMGTIKNIIAALRGIFNKVRTSDINDQDILKTLKMIISNIASGMIIGKSGGTIKTIQQTCNVRIQITNKDETKGLPERTMTISAESSEYLLAAVKDILTRLLHDPEADKWKRLMTYSGYVVSSSGGGGGVSVSSPGSTTSGDYSSFIQSMIQHPSYSALTSLQSSTSLPNGPGYQSSGSASDSGSALTQAMLAYMYSQSLSSNSPYFTRYAPVMIDGVNLTVPGATLATFEIAIPEVMINSVLGVGASLVSELMQTTNTRIQLSGKGDYIPGTYNRKLTITGPILSVQSAHLMIMQNIIRDSETYRKQGLI